MPEKIGKGILEVGFDPDQIKQAGDKEVLPSAKRLAADVVSTFAAVKLVGFAKDGIEELKAAQAASANVESVIRATGGAANVTAAQVDALAESQMRLTGVDDETIKLSQAKLLTFKNVADQVGEGNDVFTRATKAGLDLAQIGFGTPESAAILLGKALNDPIKGMTALGRAGVTFSEDQEAAIKSLVDSNDLLGAQKIILGEVESQVDGAAAAFGETLPGKIAIAEQSLENMKGAVVAGAAPALQLGAEAATFLADKFQELPEGAQATVGGLALVGGAVGALVNPVRDTLQILDLLRTRRQAKIAQDAAEIASNDAVAASEGRRAAGSGRLATSLGAVTAALGPLAIGAGIGAAALAVFGDGTTDINKKVKELAATGDEELLPMFNRLSEFDQVKLLGTLSGSGDVGVGVLVRLRDAARAAGEETAVYDTAISQAKQKQDQFNASAAAGAEEIHGVGEAAAEPIPTEEQEALARWYKAIEENANAAEEAALQLAPADIRVRRGALGIEEDKRAIAEAERTLANLRKMGTPEMIAEAERDLEEKRLALEEATLNQAEAEQTLAEERFKAAGLPLDQSAATDVYLGALGRLTEKYNGPVRDSLARYIWDTTVAIQRTRELAEGTEPGYYGDPSGAPRRIAGGQARAAGGSIMGAFRGAEHGPELLLTDGIYQAPPGGGYVVDAHTTAEIFAGGGGPSFNVDTIVVQGHDAVRAVDRLPDALRVEMHLAGV